MKKQTFTLLVILILSLTITACGQTAEAETLKPVDPNAWPTPQRVPALPTPTPFPKITLADVEARPTADDLADVVEPNNITTAPTAVAPVAEPASLTDKTSAVMSGQVNTTALNLREGPGVDYNRLAVLKQGQVVDVLGLNPAKNWALVESGGQTGWVARSYIDLFKTEGILPVVEPAGHSQPSASRETITVSAGAPTNTLPATLSPVAEARISVNKTGLRPGPGTAFAPFAELSDPVEALTVLGVDPSRSWALIDPEYNRSHLGWVALSDIQLTTGNLDSAPVVVTAWVNSSNVTVRAEPGIYAEPVGTVAINSLVLVQGVNPVRSWAHISMPTGPGAGWLPLQFMTVHHNIDDLPVYREAPVAQVAATSPADALPTSQPAYPPVNKLVLQLSSGGDIVTINPDGSGLRHLTTGIDPVLSPDGKTVAFTRWQGDNGSVWLINVDGSNERQVLGFVKQPKGVDWSPDGSQLVINFQHEGRLEPKTVCHDLSEGDPPSPPANAYGYLDDNNDVKVKVDIKGQTEYDVDFCYTLPPDPHWGLRVINIADGSYEDLDGGTYAFRPAWDPAQPWRIVSDGGHGLLATDINQKSHQKLSENVDDSSPVFSPDGRFIALSAGQLGGGSQGYDIYRLNADGSGRLRLTDTPLWAAVQPDKRQAWNNVAPAWSPDGSQIAFLTDRSGRWEVWVMNADGSNPHAMFSQAVNDQLDITYNFVDERMISWR